MGELTINEKRKIIRREFKQFNQENGFRFVRPNTLLREQKDILQYLQFKIKAGYMKLRNRISSFFRGHTVKEVARCHGVQIAVQHISSNVSHLRQIVTQVAVNVKPLANKIIQMSKRVFVRTHKIMMPTEKKHVLLANIIYM